jgi:hypothetical protein
MLPDAPSAHVRIFTPNCSQEAAMKISEEYVLKVETLASLVPIARERTQPKFNPARI